MKISSAYITSNWHSEDWVIISWNQQLPQQQNIQSLLFFNQLRSITENKKDVRSIFTVAGGAVVQYFSKQSDVRPLACTSLKRTEDDNSRTAGLCNQWTYQRWGDTNSQGRLSNYANYVPHLHHWSLTPIDSRWECDDYNIPDKEFFGLSSGNFCKVFVRLGRLK